MFECWTCNVAKIAVAKHNSTITWNVIIIVKEKKSTRIKLLSKSFSPKKQIRSTSAIFKIAVPRDSAWEEEAGAISSDGKKHN